MSKTISRPRWRLHVGAARAIQAFDAGAVTPKDSLEINFEATRLRQYGTRGARPRQSEAAVRPRASGLVILSGSIAENIHFVRRRPRTNRLRRLWPERRLIGSQRHREKNTGH